MFTKYKQCRANQKVNEQHMRYTKSCYKVKTKAAQKSHAETMTAAYTCIQLPRLDHMEQSSPLNTPPHPILSHPVPTHSTPPMYDSPLCMCCEVRKKKKDPETYCHWRNGPNESELSNKGGTYIQEGSHGPPTEKKRSVQWFQSGKTIVTLERGGERARERERKRERVREMEQEVRERT